MSGRDHRCTGLGAFALLTLALSPLVAAAAGQPGEFFRDGTPTAATIETPTPTYAELRLRLLALTLAESSLGGDPARYPRLPAHTAFWFGWRAAHPDTHLVSGITQPSSTSLRDSMPR